MSLLANKAKETALRQDAEHVRMRQEAVTRKRQSLMVTASRLLDVLVSEIRPKQCNPDAVDEWEFSLDGMEFYAKYDWTHKNWTLSVWSKSEELVPIMDLGALGRLLIKGKVVPK